MKLKSKLIIGMLIVALLPLITSFGTLFRDNVRTTRQLTVDLAYHQLELTAGELSAYFGKRISEIKTYARAPVIRSMSPGKFIPFIKEEIKYKNDYFEKFLVGRPDGQYYYSGGGNPYLGNVASFNDARPGTRAKSIAKRDYWLYTLGNNPAAEERSYVSNPMISYTTGAKQIIIASSILDKNNKLVGMFGGSLPWETIEKKITQLRKKLETQLPWDIRFFLISPEGIYWYHWDLNKVVHIKLDKNGKPVINRQGENTSVRTRITDDPNPAFAAIGQKMINGEDGYQFYTDQQSGEKTAIFYEPIQNSGYSVAIQVPYSQINAPVVDVIRTQSILTLAAILLVVFVAVYLSRKISNPISLLRDAANKVALGHWNYPLPEGGNDEVSDLATAFQLMTTSLQVREQSLASSEERFALAMQGANDGLWDWNLLEKKIYLSPRWKNMLGYTDEEFINSFKYFEAHVHPDDLEHVKQQIDTCLAGEINKYETEFRMRHKDGHYVDILSRGFVVRRKSDNLAIRFVGTHVDISERKQIEQALINAKNMAEEASRAKSQFLSSMSHELRTPMNAILGFSQLLILNEQDENTKSYLMEIMDAGNHLLGLINEILDLSRIESGNINLVIDNFSLNTLLKNSLSLIKPIADKRGIMIENRITTLPEIYIHVDDTRFKQVLLNLLSNAVKYNNENGHITIDGKYKDGNMFYLSVTDTGIGLSAEKIKSLFNIYERVGQEFSAIEGAGLGLVITKDLVELMGGTIGVESTVDKGTTFWIQVPLATKSG